jgi:hypothetical protein
VRLQVAAHSFSDHEADEDARTLRNHTEIARRWSGQILILEPMRAHWIRRPLDSPAPAFHVELRAPG